MGVDFPGLGTVINVITVIVGALAGMAIGQRFPERTKGVVTDILGLVTLLMAGLTMVSVTDAALREAVGPSAPILIVLGSLLIGGIAGSLLRIEQRLGALASVVHRRFGRAEPAGLSEHSAGDQQEGEPDPNSPASLTARERFIEGWLTATLLFCVGPLTILGSINDGLGRGIDQLALKSVLDGFAAMAFASTFGIGVLFSAVSVAVIQGSLTFLGWGLGEFLPDAHIAALTATGGVLLAGIGLRLLRIRDVPVGDMLPALLVAPLLTLVVIGFR
ncbi:MAG: DUF554 domain-containing protein [Actinomycetia bacterium]|nr:DUF554 domain-containing protein [Actinomycetes bacterium]